ncbi:MAG: hypothetical protein RE471_05985 [Ferroplasma sp.]|nr:hypothetical protein [Ferroplasma sp.]WMT50530.1 MAG: hypothetical protein RE471_05985 [Ferroplasma sp.]
MIGSEVWRMIKNMVERGISKAEIARQLGIDSKTVRK